MHFNKFLEVVFSFIPCRKWDCIPQPYTKSRKEYDKTFSLEAWIRSLSEVEERVQYE